MRYELIFIFCICIFNYSSSICWEHHYFPTKLCSPLCQKSVAYICVWIYLWIFYSVPQICLSILMLYPHCLLYASYSNGTYYMICPLILFIVCFPQPLGCKLHKGWDFCHFCSLLFPRIFHSFPECYYNVVTGYMLLNKQMNGQK